MGVKIKRIGDQEFEVLEHGEKPGFRKAFHIVLGVMVVYFIYIFSPLH